MSEFAPDVEGAAAFIQEQLRAQESETTPEPAATPPAEQANEPTTTEPSSEGTTSQEESFTKLDPNALPEELQVVYKQMQGAFTRKTQEIADLRKQYESLGDLGRVQMSVEFANRFENDPAFQQQVYQALAQRVQGLQPQAVNNPMDEMDDEDAVALPPEVQQKLSKLDALEQKLSQFEAQQYQMWYQNEMLSQESKVRQAHPEWSDDDIKYLYDLAPAHEGSLENAARALEAIQEQTIARYWNLKQKAPAPSLPVSSGAQPHPGGFKTIKEAGQAAQQLVANFLADQ